MLLVLFIYIMYKRITSTVDRILDDKEKLIKKSRALGPDNLSVTMLKYVGTETLKVVQKIVNNCLRNGTVPGELERRETHADQQKSGVLQNQ